MADLMSTTGAFIATLAIGEGPEYEGAQIAPSFTSDGRFVSVLTTRGSFGLWSTETLERIDTRSGADWQPGWLMGDWLLRQRVRSRFRSPTQERSARWRWSESGRVHGGWHTPAVGKSDGVSLWNYDTDTWADIACRFAGRNTTADEWAQVGPRTVEFRETCDTAS